MTCPAIPSSQSKRVRLDPSAPRLVIESIEFENFKSYLGKKKIGPFHSSLSCIIGPNGSGKSNVIDGLLFVFGKRAKQIRLSKLSELIYSGPCEVPPAFARVSVHFHEVIDCPLSSAPVPGSHVTVSRTVHRPNTSTYHLNNKPATWPELHSFFLSKAVDLDHNRFLILQGEVEQIALMKPLGTSEGEEGLLEYLEDLIGSNEYVAAITQSKGELDEHVNSRDAALSRLKIGEREVQALEGPRKQAEQHIKVTAKKCVQEALYLQGERHGERKQLQTAEEQLNKGKEELKKKREEEKEKTKEKDEITQVCETKKKDLANIRKAFDEVKRKEAKKEEDHMKIKQECEQLIKEKSDKTKKMRQYKDTASKVRGDLEGVVTERDQLKESLAYAQTMHDQAENAYREMAQKANVAEADAEKKGIYEQIHKLRKIVKELDDRVKRSEGGLAASQDEHKKFNAAKGRWQELLDKAKVELKEREEGEKQARLFAEATVEKSQKIAIKKTEIEKNMHNLQPEVKTAKTRYEELARKLEAQSGKSAKANILSAAAGEGPLAGCRVYGVVADFVSVPDEYQLALATGLGTFAESVVVQSDTDSSKIFQYLRSCRGGRVHCYVLDRLSPSPMPAASEPGSHAGQVQRLIDVVKISNPKIAPAVQAALGKTLVVDNIRRAADVAEQRRARVVTLKGELAEASGAMTGGGTHRGAPQGARQQGPLVRKEEVEQARLRFEALEAKKEELRNQAKELQDAKNALEPERIDADTQARALQSTITYVKIDIEKHQKELTNLHNRYPKAAELDGLKADLDRATAEKDTRETEIIKCMAAVETVERKVAQRLGPKAVQLREVVEDTAAHISSDRKKLDDIERELAKAEANIASDEENAARLADEIEQYAAKIEAMSEKRVRLNKEYEQAFIDATAMGEGLARLGAEFEGIKKKLGEIDKKFKEVRKVVEKAEAEVEEAKQKFEQVKARVNALSDRLNKVRDGFKNLPLDLLGEQDQDDILCMIENSALHEDIHADVLEGLDMHEVHTELVRLLAQVESGKSNLKAIEDYREKFTEYKKKKEDFDAVNAARDQCKAKLEDLEQKRLSDFSRGFQEIALKLKELYQMLTLGGDAELEFVDPASPFTKGISFSVRPPKKSWKQISNLSGGEKTLSSLALVFALHYFRPTPLYFLDEIDAALDSHNVQIIANYLKERARGAQFIVISLRNHMFEIADWIVGVYKTHNQSKSLAIDPRNPSSSVLTH